MFVHTHPYEPFLFNEATKLIVGTLPPPRFTQGDLKEGDVNFCYGSRDGQLWPILNRIFNLNLSFETTERAIAERKAFLQNRKIGICDIVASAEREKIDASDLGMQDAMNINFQVTEKRENELLVKIENDEASNALLQYLIQKGVHIRSFHEILPTLNEIFIRQVKG